MKSCIYCRQSVDQSKLTLEHVIPQFLGGACALDHYKTRDVCARCNNNLGLFVDASFEKDWFVSQTLSTMAHKTYDPDRDVGLPLIGMGAADLAVPGLLPGEVCESWLGPFGEQVYWVRPADERMYWYMGGNPRTAKSVRTRAYFMFSVRSHIDPLRTVRTFRDAFSDRKVKKILCTEISGADPKSMGFTEPDACDAERSEFFLNHCANIRSRDMQVSMNVQYDVRFLAKLAIGMMYCVFGEHLLKTEYADELYKALVMRSDDVMPDIRYVNSLTMGKDPNFNRLMGNEGCVTVALLPSPEGFNIVLNLDASMSWMIKSADMATLTEPDLVSIGQGRVIVLARHMQKSVELPFVDYIAHKTGSNANPNLRNIESRVQQLKQCDAEPKSPK